MQSQEVFSLTEVAGFFQGAQGCLMAPCAAPAPFVNLDPLFQLFFGKSGYVTALTEIMFSALTVGTVRFPLVCLL